MDGMQAIRQENHRLLVQLATCQLQVQQLLAFVQSCIDYGGMTDDGWVTEKAMQAITAHQDTTALESLIAKAGEVMRERAVKAGYPRKVVEVVQHIGAIRALPGVTLEDLK